MENYIVSARKYRPLSFDTVVGQESLTTTLKNAIATGKLAHAYLFCGPRGVGKTTCARIFAKTINCLSPTQNGEACNACESCVAFNEQRSYNIHELDAASNNSVDDIRSLIEQVRIAPQVGKYKVFIIDEVHMLSQAAFNAFLKTLEEPPAHAIFILATTERHKILPTILSRCQLYDFNRIEVKDMVNHLMKVAQNEGVRYEEDALTVIAQKADGGLRDALSIFDQIVSFTHGDVTHQKVIANLNVLDFEYYFRMADMLVSHKISDAMLLFNEVLSKGFDGSHFVSGFASHLRDLLMCKDSVTLPLLEVTEQIRLRYQEQAQRCDVKFLYRAMKLCNDCDLNYRTSKNKRLLVEITLIQVGQLSADDDESSGLRPNKKIKPLFQKLVASPRPATNGQVVPSTAHGVQPSNSVSTVSPKTGEAIKHLSHSVGQSSSSTVPTVKKGAMGISIRSAQVTETSSRVTTAPQANTVAEKPSEYASQTAVPKSSVVMELTNSNLRYCWREYSNQLPQAYRALAGRMQNIEPDLLKDGLFEVLVDNIEVQKFLQSEMAKIERYIRQRLNNDTIKMLVRVAEAGEVDRAYSGREILEMMSKKNKSLEKLKSCFGLDLA